TRWSKHSRLSNNEDEKFLGEDKEWLIGYAKELESTQHHDYYIFGHRHLPYDVELNSNSRILNLGEWINYHTYAVWDGETLRLEKWASKS
ncbi:MAG TPA: UDP-2,3-diacylglucosamine hydrolase, partial [Sphingobacterium sp.]|nr:UDP-2,3-diacylglucosamine hydrolase [Sphingobacterium sp.]